MIRNISYNDKAIKREIEALVGKAISWSDRFSMKGIGSPRYTVYTASSRIASLLNQDNNINYCNIELRPAGIIIGFRSNLETYGWIIPYHALNVFKSQGYFTIYSGEDFIRLFNPQKSKAHQEFLRKLMSLKAEAAQMFSFLN